MGDWFDYNRSIFGFWRLENVLVVFHNLIMTERVNILRPQPETHQGISQEIEIPDAKAPLVIKPSMLDRILSSPTSKHITYTSGPNSR